MNCLCLREIEIDKSYDVELLSIKEYVFDIETNSTKARTSIYVSSYLNYSRHKNLESIDSNMLILSVMSKKEH